MKSKPPTFELKKDDNTASQLSSLGQKISERFIEVSTKNKDHRFDKENEKISRTDSSRHSSLKDEFEKKINKENIYKINFGNLIQEERDIHKQSNSEHKTNFSSKKNQRLSEIIPELTRQDLELLDEIEKQLFVDTSNTKNSSDENKKISKQILKEDRKSVV